MADDLLSLLNQSPLQRRPERAAMQGAGGGGMFGFIEGLAKQIDGMPSAYSREISRSMYEGVLSRVLRFQVRIPSMEEVALAENAREIHKDQIRKQEAIATLDNAREAFYDLPPAVKQKWGVDDTLPEMDPDKFIQLVNTEKLVSRPLSRGLLSKAGYDPEMLIPEYRAAKQAAAAEKQRREAMSTESAELSLEKERAGYVPAMAKSRAETAKVVEQAAGGEGVYGQLMAAARQQVEGSLGVDLTASALGPDVDTDEPRGAMGELAYYDLGFKQIGNDLKPPNYATAWKALAWPRIKDQLEEVPAAEDGSVPIGVGHTGLDPDAQPFLIGTVLRYARDKNIPLNQAFTELELPYRVNEKTERKLVADLLAWGKDYAQRTGQDAAQIVNSLFGGQIMQGGK